MQLGYSFRATHTHKLNTLMSYLTDYTGHLHAPLTSAEKQECAKVLSHPCLLYNVEVHAHGETNP